DTSEGRERAYHGGPARLGEASLRSCRRSGALGVLSRALGGGASRERRSALGAGSSVCARTTGAATLVAAASPSRTRCRSFGGGDAGRHGASAGEAPAGGGACRAPGGPPARPAMAAEGPGGRGG